MGSLSLILIIRQISGSMSQTELRANVKYMSQDTVAPKKSKTALLGYCSQVSHSMAG